MINLLIDTSYNELSVAIASDTEIIDSVNYEAWQRQSEYLVAEIDGLLKKHSLSRKDISAIVASKGPGSYTGVRIALTVAKVMALALNVPLYTVSSLEVLKVNDGPWLCLSNARSSRSYSGLYENGKALRDDGVMTNDEVLSFLKEHPDVTACGHLEYLGLEDNFGDIFKNLLAAKKEEHLEKEPLKVTPVYLKN